jgi:hypothetical protein
MSDSLKMARLDFASLKSQYLYVAGVVSMAFFSIMGGTFAMPMFITAAWYSALVVSVLFSLQEKNGLHRLYGSLSISQKDIVLGRYVFMLSFFGLSLLIGLVCHACLMAVQGKPLDVIDLMSGLGLSLLIFSLTVGIQTPLFFKWGYLRARLWSLVIFFGVIFGVAFIPPLIGVVSDMAGFLPFATELWQKQQILLGLGGMVAGCAILLISHRIALAAYRKHY